MKTLLLIAAILLVLPCMALANPAEPTIAITTDIEDGKKMIHVLVSLNNKPLENVVLQYYVQRTFGSLLIGEDTTLDDGTSAVAFPSDLPAAADGNLHVLVRIKGPPQYITIVNGAAFPADVAPPPAVDAFPRALWAPHAPLALMASIFALLAGVWLSYFFVLSRILAIRSGAPQ